MPALPPDETRALLEERALALDLGLAHWRGVRELLEERGLPRVLWVEAEYAARMHEAELGYTRQLIEDISADALGGIEWWRAIHASGAFDMPPPGVPWAPRAAEEAIDGRSSHE
jgi:hypothetical protein